MDGSQQVGRCRWVAAGDDIDNDYDDKTRQKRPSLEGGTELRKQKGRRKGQGEGPRKGKSNGDKYQTVSMVAWLLIMIIICFKARIRDGNFD